MRILAIISGEYGDRHVANIRKHGPKDWEVQTWVPPRILPQIIDEPEEFLPTALGEADLVLAFQEDARAAQLICDVAKLCKAKAVICAIDREEWLPRGLAKQLTQWLSKAGIASVFPKPLCALDDRDANVKASPQITEFVRHFGRPTFRFDCDPGTRNITVAEVTRDAVCGCARFAAQKIVGAHADDAEQAIGLAHHHFPCLASMDDDSDFGDTLMHVSGNIMKKATVEALGPWREVKYFTPDGGQP
ncbi:MAG: DUF166 family protein [Spirochaetota bacterium]